MFSIVWAQRAYADSINFLNVNITYLTLSMSANDGSGVADRLSRYHRIPCACSISRGPQCCTSQFAQSRPIFVSPSSRTMSESPSATAARR
jgi:hypothetical protein